MNYRIENNLNQNIPSTYSFQTISNSKTRYCENVEFRQEQSNQLPNQAIMDGCKSQNATKNITLNNKNAINIEKQVFNIIQQNSISDICQNIEMERESKNKDIDNRDFNQKSTNKLEKNSTVDFYSKNGYYNSQFDSNGCKTVIDDISNVDQVNIINSSKLQEKSIKSETSFNLNNSIKVEDGLSFNNKAPEYKVLFSNMLILLNKL